MSTYQLGFIGTGNMGGALAQAAAKSGADMLLSNRTAAKAEALAAKLGWGLSRAKAQGRSQNKRTFWYSASSRRCSRHCWRN